MLFTWGLTRASIAYGGCLLGLMLISGIVAADEGAPSSQPRDTALLSHSKGAMDGTFAVVGGEKISMEEFRVNLRVGIRRRFFHGNIPDKELKSFRHDVADTLITNAMLRQEAQRRGIKPDERWVSKKLKEYEREYAGGKAFRSQRDQIIASLRDKLEQDSLVNQLHRRIKDVSAPDAAQVHEYYLKHPDKFTTPEALRVSVILLKVDPSAPSSAWRAAEQKARRLVKRIRQGDDFEALAYKYSGDKSAEDGGDLGFVHKGRMAKEAQQVLDHLHVGEVSDPVQLLRGITIFRLDERRPPMLNSFELVKKRARKLLMRERAKRAWEALRDRLRKNTPFTVNETAL